MLKLILYILLQCTWGGLQTLLGLCVFILSVNRRHYVYRGAIVTEWNNTAGLSLGLFVFVPGQELSKKNENEYQALLNHEYGHTIQSLVLGPLYLPAAAIPSFLWFNLPVCKKMRKERQISYYSFYTEKWANAWGGLPGGLTSFGLHFFAMVFMLSDHLWATLVPGQEWMSSVGRLAFPMFAFLTAEGYYHTKDFKKYLKRMVFFALLSELPFNLMYNGTLFYPFHQNVLWTFVLSLLCMRCLDRQRKRKTGITKAVLCALITGGFMLAATLMMADYYGYGLLMAVVFYVFRGAEWYYKTGQLGLMLLINGYLIKGLVFPIEIGGFFMEISQQAFALFALLPIWLYNGRRGPEGKAVQYFYYLFYPAHMLLLWLAFSH